MSAPPVFAELFAGAAGFSLGFHRAGWRCAWHAEKNGRLRAKVLRRHFPAVPVKGDVKRVRPRTVKKLIRRHGAIDALIFGSPCQDLSVAGKRAGLGGARSSLYFEAIRIWHEIAEAQGFYPELLWENVDGARSSNEGRDFAEVLRAIVGAAVPVPADGWRSAGVVAGPTGVAAWRVLDAQYFGVPQRRRRVFVLGTRTGRIDPAEVLALSEGVRGDSPARGEAGEVAPCLPASGAGTARTGNARTESGLVVLGFHHTQDPIHNPERSPALGATTDGMGVLAFSAKDSGADATLNVAPTLRAGTHDKSWENGGVMPAVLAFSESGQGWWGEGVAPLRADPGGMPSHVCLTGDITHALTHEGHDASEDGTGRGTPIVARCVTAGEGQRNDWETCTIVTGTLGAEHARKPGQQEAAANLVPVTNGIPRRLTPLECERLMGWPDGWTAALGSDSARYRACGNGVASHVAQWIAERLGEALTVEREQVA